MDAAAFAEKWGKTELSERSGAYQHFLDLCDLFQFPKPAEADRKGLSYAIEKATTKADGRRGFADVWKHGHFAWEYKKPGEDLDKAYGQLLQYHGALGNPPLLVVSDMRRIVIASHFTGYPTVRTEIKPEGFATKKSQDILRRFFHDPDSFRPEQTTAAITEKAARRLAEIAPGVRARHADPTAVAHFLDRLIFCMFAEDIGLLPADGFRKILKNLGRDPRSIAADVQALFQAMAGGGTHWGEPIEHFNGHLFDGTDALELRGAEWEVVEEVARQYDWSQLDVSIFGTLFERVMDEGKRKQLGAHYTSFDDIRTLVEPVVMAPLRRDWQAVRDLVGSLMPWTLADEPDPAPPPTPAEAQQAIDDFLARLRALRVLDPACGSGNFLYVTLKLLKDLEMEALVYSRSHGLRDFDLAVGPHQLLGLEINPYAHDLAQMTVWIGLLQWQRDNGFPILQRPILRPLDTIRLGDAILDLSDPDHPREPEWPDAECIVGNPPFLGNKSLRSEFGEDYCNKLWELYGDRIPAMSDLCAYWFEKARAMIEVRRVRSAGLLATAGIRQVGGRRVLERIAATGRIFFAVPDQKWFDRGVSVRICMVGFDSGTDATRTSIASDPEARIGANLDTGVQVASASKLSANKGRCYMGTTKVGAFDFDLGLALHMLVDPNPHGRPNSDVIRPFRNGRDLVRINSDRCIIDYGTTATEATAMQYAMPFAYIEQNVKSLRIENNRKSRSERWWLLGETLPAFRGAVGMLNRFIATPRVAKHRVFIWLGTETLPDSKVIAFCYENDSSLGILSSSTHECWTLANCGWHGVGRDATYNPTTCFETFPFPVPIQSHVEQIGAAAKELDRLRSNWLNPPEWTKTEVLEFPGSVDGPWRRFVHDADERGIGTVRYPRVVPRNADCALKLAKRTLTNLYNERPAWLAHAHRDLDAAVFAAYGWDDDPSDDAILARLLALNLERAGAGSAPAAAEEGEGDEG